MNKRSLSTLLHISLALGTLATFACRDSASAGQSVSVQSTDESGECSDACEVVLKRLVSLSDSAKPGLLAARPNIQRSADGRYYTTIADYSGFAVFDSVGKLLHVFGRRGDGPGEFTFLSRLALRGNDTVFAFDLRSGRLSVIVGDSAMVRSVSAFPATPTLVLGDGSFLVAEQLRDPKHIGWPLHVVGADGRVSRSFGGTGAQFRRDLNRLQSRVAGRGAGSSFWAAPPGRYILEQWDPMSSKLLRTVKVDAKWFEESDHAPQYSYLQERPTPTIVSVWSSDDKLVWTLIVTADENWRQRQSITDASEQPANPQIHDASYDYLLQAVDVRAGKIVASKRLDREIYATPPSNLLVSHSDAGGANVVVDVWQPTLQRKKK